jgi:hypothetical protein
MVKIAEQFSEKPFTTDASAQAALFECLIEADQWSESGAVVSGSPPS